MFTLIEYAEKVFRELDFSRQQLVSKEFHDCTFIRCNFGETIFKKCTFLNCTFENCDLSLMKVKYSTFVNSIFKDSKVLGVNWSEASFRAGGLSSPIHFFRCIISHSTFIGLNLRETHIKECLAKDVDFREALLTKSDLSHTDFIDSVFVKTNLTGADLTGSRNYNINATLNTIRKAKFSFPEAISLLYGLDIVLVE